MGPRARSSLAAVAACAMGILAGGSAVTDPQPRATALLPFAHGTFALHCDSLRSGGLEAAVSLAVAPGQATLTGRAKVGDGRATTFRVDPGQQVATALSSARHQTWLVRHHHKPAPQITRLDVRYEPIPDSRACAITHLNLRPLVL